MIDFLPQATRDTDLLKPSRVRPGSPGLTR
jgi:hypothetical protein